MTKMMKNLGICGSPRKGNTEFMIRRILDSAKKNSTKTELILLRNLNIEHCNRCGLCTKRNAQYDDMQKLYNKMRG